MNNGLLFDTSVWIDFFVGTINEETSLLTKCLEDDIPVYVCPVILQEVLQGIVNDKDFRNVKESFLALNMLLEEPVGASIGAAEIFRALRKKGVTIRRSNDCLIAWYALKNSLEIIHRDRDFEQILRFLSVLKK